MVKIWARAEEQKVWRAAQGTGLEEGLRGGSKDTGGVRVCEKRILGSGAERGVKSVGWRCTRSHSGGGVAGA